MQTIYRHQLIQDTTESVRTQNPFSFRWMSLGAHYKYGSNNWIVFFSTNMCESFVLFFPFSVCLEWTNKLDTFGYNAKRKSGSHRGCVLQTWHFIPAMDTNRYESITSMRTDFHINLVLIHFPPPRLLPNKGGRRAACMNFDHKLATIGGKTMWKTWTDRNKETKTEYCVRFVLLVHCCCLINSILCAVLLCAESS